MSNQIKSTCATYVLHSRQGRSLGDQDLTNFFLVYAVMLREQPIISNNVTANDKHDTMITR